MPTVDYTPTTVVIVISIDCGANGKTMMGIVADAVSDVLDIERSDIKTAPNLGSRIDTRYMHGMYVGKKSMVMLLNVDRLLDPEEFAGIVDLPSSPKN